MFDRRATIRRIDDRTAGRLNKEFWARKRADAAQGAGLLARMESAGVNSAAELYALEAR